MYKNAMFRPIGDVCIGRVLICSKKMLDKKIIIILFEFISYVLHYCSFVQIFSLFTFDWFFFPVHTFMFVFANSSDICLSCVFVIILLNVAPPLPSLCVILYVNVFVKCRWADLRKREDQRPGGGCRQDPAGTFRVLDGTIIEHAVHLITILISLNKYYIYILKSTSLSLPVHVLYFFWFWFRFGNLFCRLSIVLKEQAFIL